MPGVLLTYVWLTALLAGPGVAVPTSPRTPVAEAPAPVPATRRVPVAAEPDRAPDAASSARRSSTSAARADQDPEAILRATASAYESLSSVAADFTQIMRNTLLGRTTEAMGTLYQKSPDKFLMEFSDPEGDRIVSDGRYFWMYFPSVDAKQVIRTPRRGQGLDLQAQFIGDPVARFEYTYEGTETFRGEETHVFTLVPREPAGYQRMKVWIDGEDHLVRQFELREENGNVRHMELRNVVVNPVLPDTLFEFTPPEGAIVVERG